MKKLNALLTIGSEMQILEATVYAEPSREGFSLRGWRKKEIARKEKWKVKEKNDFFGGEGGRKESRQKEFISVRYVPIFQERENCIIGQAKEGIPVPV
jgi:hypothetical protein